MYWKLSTVRCLLYGAIVAWGMFVSGTEGFTSLSEMSGLQLIKLLGNMLFAGFGGVVLAFLDQTLSRLQSQKPQPEQPPKTPEQ